MTRAQHWSKQGSMSFWPVMNRQSALYIDYAQASLTMADWHDMHDS
jgi:hypothetical protein